MDDSKTMQKNIETRDTHKT